MCGFKLRRSGFPQIFSAPSGETVQRTPKSFRGARTLSRFSITVPSLVGLGFYLPSGGQRRCFLSVNCLFVRHASKRQSLCARFRHEGVGLQKRF